MPPKQSRKAQAAKSGKASSPSKKTNNKKSTTAQSKEDEKVPSEPRLKKVSTTDLLKRVCVTKIKQSPQKKSPQKAKPVPRGTKAVVAKKPPASKNGKANKKSQVNARFASQKQSTDAGGDEIVAKDNETSQPKAKRTQKKKANAKQDVNAKCKNKAKTGKTKGPSKTDLSMIPESSSPKSKEPLKDVKSKKKVSDTSPATPKGAQEKYAPTKSLLKDDEKVELKTSLLDEDVESERDMALPPTNLQDVKSENNTDFEKSVYESDLSDEVERTNSKEETVYGLHMHKLKEFKIMLRKVNEVDFEGRGKVSIQEDALENTKVKLTEETTDLDKGKVEIENADDIKTAALISTETGDEVKASDSITDTKMFVGDVEETDKECYKLEKEEKMCQEAETQREEALEDVKMEVEDEKEVSEVEAISDNSNSELVSKETELSDNSNASMSSTDEDQTSTINKEEQTLKMSDELKCDDYDNNDNISHGDDDKSPKLSSPSPNVEESKDIGEGSSEEFEGFACATGKKTLEMLVDARNTITAQAETTDDDSKTFGTSDDYSESAGDMDEVHKNDESLESEQIYDENAKNTSRDNETSDAGSDDNSSACGGNDTITRSNLRKSHDGKSEEEEDVKEKNITKNPKPGSASKKSSHTPDEIGGFQDAKRKSVQKSKQSKKSRGKIIECMDLEKMDSSESDNAERLTQISEVSSKEPGAEAGMKRPDDSEVGDDLEESRKTYKSDENSVKRKVSVDILLKHKAKGTIALQPETIKTGKKLGRKTRWDDSRKLEECFTGSLSGENVASVRNAEEGNADTSNNDRDALWKSKDIRKDIERPTSSMELASDENFDSLVILTDQFLNESLENLRFSQGPNVIKWELASDENFDSVMMLTDQFLNNSLENLRFSEDPNMHIVVEQDLTPDTLVSVVFRNKYRFSNKALWMLASGIFNVAESDTHPECSECHRPLERLRIVGDSYPSVEEIAEDVQRMVEMIQPVCKNVQDILGSEGLFVLCPPVPISVVLEEAYSAHHYIHGACKKHFTFCIDSETMSSLHITYNLFCDIWTQYACEQIKPWLPIHLFENYKWSVRGKNITAIRNPNKFSPYSLTAWETMMKSVAEMVTSMPFPKSVVPVNIGFKEKPLFDNVVIMGNIKCLDYLKELTTGLPVSFVDLYINFSEDSIETLKEEQTKWPPKTLCLIISGISSITELFPCGPKCFKASCDDSLPIFIPKNHEEGDPSFSEKSIAEMADTVARRAFDFAQNAMDYLKEGCGLFLAPIMPIQAVWGEKNSKFSHESIHKIVESLSVPVLGASPNIWQNCAEEFENKWLELTVENLERGSKVYTLYEKYKARKEDVIQFIQDADVEKTDSDYKKFWSKTVNMIVRDFLKMNEDEDILQLEVRPSDYRDIINFAKTRYAVKNNQDRNMGDSLGGWQQWSFKGQQQQQQQQIQQHSYDGSSFPYQSPDASVYGSYGPGNWMMGQNTWCPPGTPPPWGAGPPPPWGAWQPAQQNMWGSRPPPPPPPTVPPPQDAASASSSPWNIGPPPPVWVTVPPPGIDVRNQSAVLQESTSSQETKSEEASVKTGTNIMVQNICTEMKRMAANGLLSLFGELTYLKWPLDHLNKPAKFLMACYNERDDAERCVRILNHVKPFGRDSEAKLVSGSNNKEEIGKLIDTDVKYVQLVQDQLKKTRDKNVLGFHDNSDRVVVSNISSLLTGRLINDIFLGLRATRNFKNLDLSVISSEEEHHFFVCGNVANILMMDGYRFPDKKLSVRLLGPNENKIITESEMEAGKAAIESVMKKYVDAIAEATANKYISKKEVNIYTFKTVRCQNEKSCKNTCHDYHVWKDRRRCPILFKYSDEMCSRLDSNGKCPAKDKCSKAHSPLEVPFHLKNFRAHICQGTKKRGNCDKNNKICAFMHPGTTEVFFDRQWRDLIVEGLDKTVTYFVGAIMNLFKVSKQNCVRVLLITPASEMVTLLVKSMEALAFSCDQEIQALPEDGRAKKATILVGTPQAVVNWMVEEKKRENVNIDRLKALIIDDGPGVASYIERHGFNFLIEFAKIKDLNKVVTTERITRQATMAFERMRILTDYKKIYAKGGNDNRNRSKSPPAKRRSSSPSWKRRASPSSPTRKTDKHSSRGHSSRYEDDRHRDDRGRERFKYDASFEEEVGFQHDMEFADQLRQERERQQAEVYREQDLLLKQQERLAEQIRMNEAIAHKQQMQRQQEMMLEQERLDKERQEKEAKDRKYEAFIAAKEHLKHEHERERKLYFDVPEAHPEYEEKYRVFLDQYRSHYPGRNDPDHCHKLWMLFWKELVSSMLETAYKKKGEMLESDFMSSRGQFETEMQPSSSLKRKSHFEESESSKYPRVETYEQPPMPQTSTYPHKSGHAGGATSYAHPPTVTPPFHTTQESSCAIPEAVSALSEVCDMLGELSPALRLVLHKIRESNMDQNETAQIFSNYNNAMVFKMALNKLNELSEKYPSPDRERLALASYHISQMLQLASSKPPVMPKKPYHGLDIQKVASATLNKDPSFIIQFITNALMYEGITNPSQDDISDIFITISNTHYRMNHDGKN
ncbi:hypothetical protein SK128_002181 [Halocaridina rubra]|uniref:C3H1-type domain-containing protein n=1 Tax=Halocaridina rubra TaxID=373956 RepID=A0AAN8WYW1_HALRR